VPRLRAGMDNPAGARASAAETWRVWVALSIVYLVWGSTYLAIRVAVRTLPPLIHAGTRFLVAGAVMYAVLRVRRGRLGMSFSARELGACALTGGALLVGGNGVVGIAEQHVPSALAALIIASVPLWVVVFRYFAGEAVAAATFFGVVAGFAGVALLLVPGAAGEGSSLAQLLLVGASISWAGGSYFSRRLALPSDPFLSTALQMLCAGTLLAGAGVVTGEVGELRSSEVSYESLAALAYLVVAGSLVAFTAYTWLLQNAPISRVATYAYVNPVVAVLLGWLLLSEPITPVMLAAAAIVVGSVALTVRLESVLPAARDAVRGKIEVPSPTRLTPPGDPPPRSPIASQR
jgi:drug/metabolite transporter (DMT)-like permease